MKAINLSRYGVAVAGMLLAFSVSAQTAKPAAENERVVPFASCGELTNDQIAAQVKSDFVQNRYPRWQDDKALLGSKPVAWVNSSEVTKQDGNFRVPLTVRGSKKQANYTVAIDCQAKTMTYSLPE